MRSLRGTLGTAIVMMAVIPANAEQPGRRLDPDGWFPAATINKTVIVYSNDRRGKVKDCVPVIGSGDDKADSAACNRMIANGIPKNIVPAYPVHQDRYVQPSDYPRKLVAVSGTSRLLVEVSAQGVVARCSVLVSSGYVELDDAACAGWSKRGRFSPAMLDGKPAAAANIVSVHFVSAY